MKNRYVYLIALAATALFEIGRWWFA